MRIRHLPLVAALVAALAHTLALAGPDATAPAPGASAPLAPKTNPQLRTPVEKRDEADASAATSLRPERPVIPQLTIPLGKEPALLKAPESGAKRSGSVRAGGNGDAAARCRAGGDEPKSAACVEATSMKRP